MNKFTLATSIVGSSVLTGTSAFAASTNQIFISGPLILLFLGFCALMVLFQCIPAMMTLYGIIKGASSNRKAAAVANRS